MLTIDLREIDEFPVVGLVPSDAVDDEGPFRRWLVEMRGSSDRILRHRHQKRRDKLDEMGGQAAVYERVALDGAGGPGAFEKSLRPGGFVSRNVA